MTTAFRPGPPVADLPSRPNTGETAPRRKSGRPKGSPAMGGRIATRSLEAQIAATLMAMNFALYLIPPLAADRLDEVEIKALARALDAQAKGSPRFRKMLEGALTVTSGGQLLGVAMIIGARRASRHGLLPPEADGQLGAMLSISVNAPQPPAPEVPYAATAGTEGSV